MTTIKNIFKTFGPEYLERFGQRMPAEHKKVIAAIVHCRSHHYGAMIYKCEQCGTNHLVYRGCGNRHCPGCQHHKSQQWLDKQLERQLPGHHFLITFTVSQTLARAIRSHQRIGYKALFDASADTLKKLAKDPKYVGADLTGFFGVLHTWGRQFTYHPHIHYVVPGGGLSKNGTWNSSPIHFFLPVKALSKIFKAKLIDIFKNAGLYDQIPATAWEKPFVVHSKAVPSGTRSIKYLSRYVFKVAIGDYRIIKVEQRHVFFKYKKVNSNRWRTMRIEVMEFMRRFLQHVLPKGFMKVRHYGFLNPNCNTLLEKIRGLIHLAHGFWLKEPEAHNKTIKTPYCRHCGGALIYCASIINYNLIPVGTG